MPPDTTVIAVGVAAGYDQAELELIASDPVANNVILVHDINCYDRLAARMVKVSCVCR